MTTRATRVRRRNRTEEPWPNSCAICLDPDPDLQLHHSRCSSDLFGIAGEVRASFDEHGIDESMASGEKMSVSGVQPKVLALVTKDGELQIASKGATHIVKPAVRQFPFAPQNEHVTMRVAAALGLNVPLCGLVPLSSGRLAYVVRRFDRDRSGTALHQLDLCQVLDWLPADKGKGTAELCADVVGQHSSEPLPSLAGLFDLFLTSYFVSNGDLHLKNISLLDSGAGLALSPAYDLICTAKYERTWSMLLRLAGAANPARRQFIAFAERCRLSASDANARIDALLSRISSVEALVRRSYLPDGCKVEYAAFLRKRVRNLRASSRRS